MLDLTVTAGLPLALDGGLRLVVPPGAGNERPAVRTLGEMRPYLADPDAHGPAEMYFMYRDLGRSADRDAYGPFGVRFDVTVIIPGAVSGELVKTAGHYHPAPSGQDGGPATTPGDRVDVSFPEVYGVIHGRAHYLLQDGRVDGPSRAFLVEAEAGEVVLVPPNFGHVTINPGPGPLVMANWVEASFASVYGPYAERRGACYYEFAGAGEGGWVGGKGGEGRVEPNPRYPAVPLERLSAPTFAALCPPGEDLWRAVKLDGRASGRSGPRPLYDLGVTEPQRLTFLTRPAAYDWGGLVGRR